MKIDPSCCRLCFTHIDDPIDIFEAISVEFNIVDMLARYFLDQVNNAKDFFVIDDSKMCFNNKIISVLIELNRWPKTMDFRR